MSEAEQDNTVNENKDSQPAYNEAPPPYPGPPVGQPQPQLPKQPVYPAGYPPQPVPNGPPAPTGPISQQPGRAQPNTVVVHHYPQSNNETVVVVRGNCPHCRVGTIIEDFTGLGIFMAICFFPCGLLCCLMMRVRRCSHCGAIV